MTSYHLRGAGPVFSGYEEMERPSYEIRDVWESNLEEEMAVIREIIQDYPFVAMDTEFPGVVAKPIGDFRSQADYYYQTLKLNVNLLNLIQLGVTFFNGNGEVPMGTCAWQFNFRFSLQADMYAQDSIDLLTRSGIQFSRHENEGIDVHHFAELLTTSGMILNDEICWVTFHSGYDFGYLLRLLTCQDLPETEKEFSELINLYFPVLYDIKYLMKSCKTLKGGLQEVADDLQVPRVGPQHQAGSDSMLTGAAFFKMREVFFDGIVDSEKFNGMLYGLGAAY